MFQCSGIFVYIVTEQGDFIKVDSKNKSYSIQVGEDYDFAGTGLNFSLTLKDKNVFSKGQNAYGQLGCGDFKSSDQEQYVQIDQSVD